LPIYALAAGINIVWVGGFFSLQEIMYMVSRPMGGKLGDRIGFRKALLWGMTMLGGTLILLALVSIAVQSSLIWLMVVACLLGISQALIFPSTIALAATQIDEQHLGAGMGIMGALKNAGKIVGPVLGGLLISWLSYPIMLLLLGVGLLTGAVLIRTTQHNINEHIRLSFGTNSGDYG